MMCDTDKNHLLNNLKVFVDEQKTWFRSVLDSVGWNISDLETLIQTDEPNLVPCSINPEHRVPHQSLLYHETRCEKINGEYPEIADVPEEVTIGYAGIVNYFHGLLISFLIDTRRDVKDSARSLTDCDGSNDLDTIDKTGKNRNEEKGKSSTCLVELLAAERDAKRRRAAHRGKRVHSNKKSYVEVLREVICSQMETLNDGSNTEPEFETTDAESVQKTIIQPHIDSYLGVGSKCFSGNPFKRWMNIEEEEQELIKEIQSGKNEKYSDHNRRRERSREKYRNVEKSAYNKDAKDHYKHREHFRDDRYRDVFKFGDNREYDSSRNERSFSSYYDYEKHSRKKPDNDHFRKELEDDHSFDLHESSDRREKKRKKKSRDRSNDSHDRADRHKKKRKKKSRERSVHKKKKHRKSKHHDSETEQS